MKKLLIIPALFLMLSFTAQAQRFAVVDVNAILSEMNDYKTAQNELDKIAETWRQDISQQMDEIKSMYNKYQAEQVLLSDDMKRQREEAIMAKEESVRKLQREKFGPDGALFAKRQELVAPIQEKVSSAIREFADQRGYDIIFDKSSATGILYNSDTYDKTEELKKKLGI